MNLKQLSLLATTAVLFLAEQAAACPSCVDPKAATTSAMLVSTIALSLLPLAFIGGVATWVVRRDLKAQHDDDTPRDQPRDQPR